eukprot:1302958-Prymnesium_polylepis.1
MDDIVGAATFARSPAATASVAFGVENARRRHAQWGIRHGARPLRGEPDEAAASGHDGKGEQRSGGPSKWTLARKVGYK